MAITYFQGTECHTCGETPKVGEKAPRFKLTGMDLKTICNDCVNPDGNTRVVLNVFPSLDTPVCAASVRRFNVEAAGKKDTKVLCVSMDLPFAMQRFCAANDIENVVMGSAFNSPEFGQKYGVTLIDGPLAGLLARSVFVIDKDGTLLYSELVDEITHEPDYEAALSVLK